MSLTILTQEEFDQHASSVARRSFQQTEEMARLLEKRGATIYRIGYIQDKQVRVSCLLYSLPMTGGLRMEINSGPLTDQAEFLASFYKELQTFAKKKGALELIIKPYDIYQSFDSQGNPTSPENHQIIDSLTRLGYQHDGLKTGYPSGEPVWHYLKNLTDIDPNSLVKSFAKTGKTHTNRAEKFGIQVKRLERSELAVFKQLTGATSERKEYEDKSLDYYQAFFDAFGEKAEFMVATLNFREYLDSLSPEQTHLQKKVNRLQTAVAANPDNLKKVRELKSLIQQLDGLDQKLAQANSLFDTYGDQDVPLAAALFIYTPQETTYLFGGSDTAFNDFYGPMLLQKYGMIRTIENGAHRYNFLGITGLFDGNDGVLRFKQKFNGHIERLPGSFRYYPNPLKYKLIQFIKRLMGRI